MHVACFLAPRVPLEPPPPPRAPPQLLRYLCLGLGGEGRKVASFSGEPVGEVPLHTLIQRGW